jgi:hypothetical protein
MIHFRQKELLTRHFVKLEQQGKISDTYKFRGKEVEITPDNFGSLDPKLKQSYSTFLSKQQGSQKRVVGSKKTTNPNKGNETNEENFDNASLVPECNDLYSKKENLIHDFLYRVSYHEKILEERLDYPKVFQRLLSQPHLAFEERKKTVESYHDLHLFVDKYTGYNPKDNGFINSLMKVAKRMKGIKLYEYPSLRDPATGKYYAEKVKELPLNSKILIFSQGCGGIGDYLNYKHKVHYITHFDKGCNCGCDTIPLHERNIRERKLNVVMHYGIQNEDHLHKLSKIN